jgi:ferredoxin
VKKFFSLLNLAYRFNVHLLKKPFAVDLPGASIFIKLYNQDNLVPLSAEARCRLPAYQGCIGCGLCDTVCPKLQPATRHLFNGPSDLATCLSRNIPDYLLLSSTLELWQECGECTDCENICPTGVPLRELSVFARATLSAIEQMHDSARDKR